MPRALKALMNTRMLAMPSDKNEAIRITESRFVGGNYTSHEEQQVILSSQFDENKSLTSISINIRLSLWYYQGKKWNMPDFWNRHNHCLSKVYRLIWSWVFSFTNLFFPPYHFSLLSSSRSHCCLPHFASTALRKKASSQKIFSTLSAMWNTRIDWRLHA